MLRVSYRASNRFSHCPIDACREKNYYHITVIRSILDIMPDNTGPRITTTNENWRGKNDPAERRRIQNRLNQRAFRERQRAGETTRQYRPRSVSTHTSPIASPKEHSDAEDDSEDGSDDDSDDDSEEDDDDDEAASSPQTTVSNRTASSTTSGSNTTASQPWDELARTINRNFMQAAVTNAQTLGLDLAALRSGSAVATPKTRSTNIPATLAPTELQQKFPHDPIIDVIPHPRLRYNILRAFATKQIDATQFNATLRRSGAITMMQGEPKRGGLVVWSSQSPDLKPSSLSAWELSEAFMLLYGRVLLEGCVDLITATNAWRQRRGERPFPTGLASSR